MAQYICYMGDNITATMTDKIINDRTYYEIAIEGSGPMYDSRDDFTYPQGQSFGSWTQAVLRCYQDSLIIPDGITTIAKSCFAGLGEFYPRFNDNERPGVYNVHCPESLRIIGDQAFSAKYYTDEHKIQSITFGHNVEKIGIRAFEHQHELTRLEFYGNPTIVNGGAFKDCHSLEYVNISDEWNSLDYTGPSYSTFNNCYKLSRISYKNKIKDIRGEMYRNCNMLTQLTIEDDDFGNYSKNVALYVDLFAGDPESLDAEGYLITEVNENSVINPYVLEYNWKDNWHRILVYYTDKFVHLYHMGKHIQIREYTRGAVPLADEDVWYFLKWVQTNEPLLNQSPLFVAHKGHWYQICY